MVTPQTRAKIGGGSALAAVAVLGMVLSPILGWPSAPRPWGFILGFVIGVLAGLGATLTVSGLVERRRAL
jgi:F0F1-type ATP synthase assembly protein I